MPGKVVVLDNEAHSISLLGHILSHLDVAGFSTVEDYLACTEKDSDCIVLDGSGMNSSDDELFRMLREHPDTSGIPVIYVGDNLSIDTRLAIYEAGVDDYVSKPFDVADLQAKVSRALHHPTPIFQPRWRRGRVSEMVPRRDCCRNRDHSGVDRDYTLEDLSPRIHSVDASGRALRSA
ncbi:MAG: response regulator, partial [Pseudomonadota bacterium]|nr:response regulator [Pseudomonadota bacterium]